MRPRLIIKIQTTSLGFVKAITLSIKGQSIQPLAVYLGRMKLDSLRFRTGRHMSFKLVKVNLIGILICRQHRLRFSLLGKPARRLFV
jgi:hypothetical protein